MALTNPRTKLEINVFCFLKFLFTIIINLESLNYATLFHNHIKSCNVLNVFLVCRS